MNDIKVIDPQEVLNATAAQFFMMVWTNSQGTYFGIGGGGFQSALHGGGAPLVVERDNAAKEYYNLVRAAKSNPVMTDGRVDLVPLPVFED